MLARTDIAIDLGTSKYSLSVRGEGLVLCEAATIAFRGDRIHPRHIVAVGDEAEAMRGRSVPGIQVISPMDQGIVASAATAGLLLKAFAKKAGLLGFLPRKGQIVLGTLWGASSLETRAFLEAANALGASQIIPVKEPFAAAIGSGIPIDESYGHMLVDVGSGATESIVIASKKIIAGRSLRMGGRAMDEALIKRLRSHYDFLLNAEQARLVRESLSALPDAATPLRLLGQDRQSSLPKALYLSREEILGAIQEPMDRILDSILELLHHCEPEMMADLIENGITLCGGASQTLTFREQLEARTQLSVKSGPAPSQAVARGCHAILEYAHFLAS